MGGETDVAAPGSEPRRSQLHLHHLLLFLQVLCGELSIAALPALETVSRLQVLLRDQDDEGQQLQGGRLAQGHRLQPGTARSCTRRRPSPTLPTAGPIIARDT